MLQIKYQFTQNEIIKLTKKKEFLWKKWTLPTTTVYLPHSFDCLLVICTRYKKYIFTLQYPCCSHLILMLFFYTYNLKLGPTKCVSAHKCKLFSRHVAIIFSKIILLLFFLVNVTLMFVFYFGYVKCIQMMIQHRWYFSSVITFY